MLVQSVITIIEKTFIVDNLLLVLVIKLIILLPLVIEVYVLVCAVEEYCHFKNYFAYDEYINLAGTPATTLPAATFFVTTPPAAIAESFSIRMPGNMMA